MQTATATNLPAVSEIQFHGTTLSIIDHEGNPFAPMKPIVEGMGLDWRTQRRKITSSKSRWGVVIMTTPSSGGDQKTLCLPLRKLHGWLCSIHPNKVRSELRPKIVLYQNECDDALWDYWTKGRAENPRAKIDPVASASLLPAALPATRLKDRAVEWVLQQTAPFRALDMNAGMGITQEYARTIIVQLTVRGLLKPVEGEQHALSDKALALVKERPVIVAKPEPLKQKALPRPEPRYTGLNIPDLSSADFSKRFVPGAEFSELSTELFCRKLITEYWNPLHESKSPIERALHWLKGTGVDASGIEMQLKLINLALVRIAKMTNGTVIVWNPSGRVDDSNPEARRAPGKGDVFVGEDGRKFTIGSCVAKYL